MIDRLTSMAVFIRAADTGSFAATGKGLGMTAQMVGKHVRALEDRLGATLLQRSTRRQSLTEAGRLFYDRCRAVLVEVESAELVMEAIGATPQGRLRISAPVGFGACRLAPILTGFMARHPAITVELNLTDRFVDLVDEGYDAVLRLGPIANTSLVARELSPHKQLACAAPSYLASRGTPETPADLISHTCLGFTNASGLPYLNWVFSKGGVPHPIRIQSHLQVNDGRVLAQIAAAGGGIVLQPEAVLREHLDAGRLLPVLTGYDAPFRPLLLLFNGGRAPAPKLRAFIDHIAAALPARSRRDA
ncbi:LysR family transcriptional regulator [Lichenihabitans sp. PAMC28606]|uniref:LysR family transcriptional regulator n=1 Tax=Lichenihabitans sp. PAMC28606 TaxID=2880932 RepID=UPI001D09EC25|nr:LysR family transcriptional regulator [Lichenihabitans sp. PAMC28606]UDL94393.1 LysR family transcriptional regulator [Lichenihabitans sp. PAMC28606]